MLWKIGGIFWIFISTNCLNISIYEKDIGLALKVTLEIITEVLMRQEEVQFIGFGTFNTSKRVVRDCVNPYTRSKMKINEM